VNQTFPIEIIISNKPQARDPEGETIARDLMHKAGYDCVKDVRTGKLLLAKIEARDEEEAKSKVLAMCNDLRLYNPIAHTITIRARN